MNNKEKEIFNEALLRFHRTESYNREVREQCLEDRRFVSISGAMWEEEWGRNFENKPKLEINKIEIALVRIYNEYRNNRITVDYTNKYGAKEDFASTLDGVYRGVEQDSVADEAYDNCFDEGVAGGMGAWRLRNCYENEDEAYETDGDSEQKIVIDPIYDADNCVFFDPNAKRQDKKDAQYCFVIYAVTKETFEEEYPEYPLSTWPKSIEQYEFDWVERNQVYVAEYYMCKKMRITKFVYQNIANENDQEILINKDYSKEELIDKQNALIERGYELVETLKQSKKRVRKYIMSGCGILEDCGEIAGSEIPIVPFYGKRFYIDGIERCHGHVRLCKDITRLKNMIVSKLAEFAATSATEKPIFHEEQINNHSNEWALANIKNYAYLTISSIQNANGVDNLVQGPLGYTKPADLPPVLAALIQQIELDLAEILGNQMQGDKMVSNISNEAVENIQERLDKQAYIYISNFAKAMRRSGEIFLSMAKEIYTEEDREVKTVNEIGEATKAIFNQKSMNEGVYEIKNDLSKVNYQVNVNVGASSDTRQEKNNKKLLALLPFVQTNQETTDIITSLLLMNTDFEGGQSIKEYYRRKLVFGGIIEPNEEERAIIEAQANAPKQPTVQEQYIQAETQKTQIETQRQMADMAKIEADINNKNADTYKKIAEVDQVERQNFIQSQAILNNSSLQTQPERLP